MLMSDEFILNENYHYILSVAFSFHLEIIV